MHRGEGISVSVLSGTPVVSPGEDSGHVEIVHRILCPLTQNEVRTIRCVGLNYKQHAAEVNMSIPLSPTIFMKPSTSLGDPWPAPTVLPKLTQLDDCGDYESELALVFGKAAKNVDEAEALGTLINVFENEE
ncbi:FAA-hydrolase domain-containing protein [Fusarium sp. Ph1]|nr:FAA-hydrolase domain-containing protein [Fusarium sp. Ph1]